MGLAAPARGGPRAAPASRGELPSLLCLLAAASTRCIRPLACLPQRGAGEPSAGGACEAESGPPCVAERLLGAPLPVARGARRALHLQLFCRSHAKKHERRPRAGARAVSRQHTRLVPLAPPAHHVRREHTQRAGALPTDNAFSPPPGTPELSAGTHQTAVRPHLPNSRSSAALRARRGPRGQSYACAPAAQAPSQSARRQRSPPPRAREDVRRARAGYCQHAAVAARTQKCARSSVRVLSAPRDARTCPRALPTLGTRSL
ncbi:hypothetical protein PsYK624_040510 [Phanerochaete sordida]|uniref:Uncharacterized protein n=1 Tax=Phanerochaete sordida TaxID=48140 RepID=A0A9P3G478_9APHY|nr:hypothetical protein PsYK624_040510 [Phanerochaete sordida]